MENSDTLELKKFIEKAPGYKDALHYAPLARMVEIFTIIGTIDGFVKDKGLSKSEIVIAEIMAGNGYLSHFLMEAGYRCIHALEASNHMANDTYLNNKYITPYAIESIFSIGDILKNVRPDVVVSIAGFHHMIEYNGASINIEQSIDKQKQVIDICMKYIKNNGILVIEDIRDKDMDDLIDQEPEFWSAKSFKKIFNKNLLPANCQKGILKTSDVVEYSNVVSEHLMPPLHQNTNPTVNWFRNVIDKETSVGHKDQPISRKLIEQLNVNYKVNYAKLNTPWIFSNISEFQLFITTFWFVEHKNNTTKLNAIFKKANEVNGVRYLEGTDRVSFGWNLALLTIQSKEQDPPSLFYPNIIALFSSLILISFVGIALKIYTTLHVSIQIVSNVLVFLAGVTAKEIYDKLKRK